MRKLLSWKDEKDINKKVSTDWKIKALKSIMSKVLNFIPNVELPEISTKEGELFLFIKEKYQEHINKLTKQMSNDWKQDIEINNLQKAILKGFNIAIVLAESDNYYRDRMMDMFILISWVHDNNRKQFGDDYLKEYQNMRATAITSRRLEWLKENKRIDDEGILEEIKKLPVEIKDNVIELLKEKGVIK